MKQFLCFSLTLLMPCALTQAQTTLTGSVLDGTGKPLSFVRIALLNSQLKYGQQTYDYDEGILSLVSPNQVLSLSIDPGTVRLKQSGWISNIHPDFL